jgi:hypothetical protein
MWCACGCGQPLLPSQLSAVGAWSAAPAASEAAPPLPLPLPPMLRATTAVYDPAAFAGGAAFMPALPAASDQRATVRL